MKTEVATSKTLLVCSGDAERRSAAVAKVLRMRMNNLNNLLNNLKNSGNFAEFHQNLAFFFRNLENFHFFEHALEIPRKFHENFEEN